MSGPLILGVMTVYAYIAIEQTTKGEPWMGLMWFGYAIANAGLFFASK